MPRGWYFGSHSVIFCVVAISQNPSRRPEVMMLVSFTWWVPLENSLEQPYTTTLDPPLFRSACSADKVYTTIVYRTIHWKTLVHWLPINGHLITSCQGEAAKDKKKRRPVSHSGLDCLKLEVLLSLISYLGQHLSYSKPMLNQTIFNMHKHYMYQIIWNGCKHSKVQLCWLCSFLIALNLNWSNCAG